MIVKCSITLICFVVFIRNGLTERYEECLDVVCPSIENAKLNCPPDSKPVIIDPSAPNSHDSTLWENALSNHHQGFARTVSKSRIRREAEELLELCCQTTKCVCNVCKVPECESKNHTAILKVQNANKPGSCCPIYECEEKPDCKKIGNGYTWLEQCLKCECHDNEFLCHETCVEQNSNSCIEGTKIYINGQHWKRDACTDCYCNNGLTKCKVSLCQQLSCHKTIQTPNNCCPICDITNSTFCPGMEYCGIVCKFDYVKSAEGCFLCKCALYETTTTITTILSTSSTTELPSKILPGDEIIAKDTIKRDNQRNILKFVIIFFVCGIIALGIGAICFICKRSQIIKAKTKYDRVEQTNSNASETSSGKVCYCEIVVT